MHVYREINKIHLIDAILQSIIFVFDCSWNCSTQHYTFFHAYIINNTNCNWSSSSFSIQEFCFTKLYNIMFIISWFGEKIALQF